MLQGTTAGSAGAFDAVGRLPGATAADRRRALVRPARHAAGEQQPAVVVLNVFELLKPKTFSRIPAGCDTPAK